MRLPFFRSKATDAAEPAPRRRRAAASGAGASAPLDDAGVEALRLRARRRLVGALVLLVLGVVLFPVLFETQPRPLPANTPILVPESGVSRPVGASPARPLPALPPDAGAEAPGAPTAAASAPVPPLAAASVPAPLVANLPAAVTGAVSGAASVPRAVPGPVAAAASRPAARPTDTAAVELKTAPKTTEARAADAKPGASRPAAEAAPGRFVVQVGAYNDMERLKAARARLEKLGYKTYTQDVDTATGRRTRLRVAPVATRAEAEAIAAKVKAAGLQAAILSL